MQTDVESRTFQRPTSMQRKAPNQRTASTVTFKAATVTMLIKHFLLALTLLQTLFVPPGYCRTSDGQSSSWLLRGAPRKHPSTDCRRGLLQIVESNVTQPADTAGTGGDGSELAAAVGRYAVITVNQFGTGDYGTVQEAIDAVPVNNTHRVVIQISSGFYREKVRIPSSKPFITLLGKASIPPVISWNDTTASAGSTWASSTFIVDSTHFIAIQITFENTAPSPPPGAIKAQAIALRITGDMAAFYNCKFLGAQDTLCDWKGRHYFKNCVIQGSIDFIYGDAQSFYEGCSIQSIATSTGSITAQYRQSSGDGSGFSFVNCIVSGTGSLMLGRAWGSFSRVVFSYTTLANIIDPLGWRLWENSTYDGNIYYGEFNNYGPGSNRTGRVSFSQALTQEEANPFLSIGWINGSDWLYLI